MQKVTPRSVTLHFRQTYIPQGVAQAPNDFITQVSWEDIVTKGGPIPHWRKVIAAGGNATTGLTGSRSQVISIPGSLQMIQQSEFDPTVNGRYVYKADGDLVTGFGLPAFNPNQDLLTKADNLALKRYYDHVNSVNTKFKGLVFSGELRESLMLIRSPARSLRKGISHYLTQLKTVGPRMRKSKRPSFVRDTWLEYSFGWRPIINDIDNAIHAFYASKAAQPIFEMVKGTGLVADIVSSSSSSQSFSQLRWYWDQSVKEEAYAKYFGIQFSNGRGISDAHKYGFHPAEFVPSIWELIPYSFLVDYFTNIGEIVQSWSYRFILNGWTARTYRQTLIQESTNEKVRQLAPDGLYKYTITGQPGSRRAETVYVSRIPDPTLSLPSLELRVPGMDSRWVNIFALSKQLDSTSRALRS